MGGGKDRPPLPCPGVFPTMGDSVSAPTSPDLSPGEGQCLPVASSPKISETLHSPPVPNPL